MKSIQSSEIRKMLIENVMGLELKQFRELVQNGIQFDFQMVAVLDDEKGADKFEIYATIHDQDLIKGSRKMVLIGQLKKTRRVTFHKAFEILREFGVKSFNVVIEDV